jgi:plastocyanin
VLARSLLVLALITASLAAPIVTRADRAAAQPGPTLTVISGYGPPMSVVEEYFPARFTVVEGTTVTWVQDTLREHTVTFLAGERLPAENIPQPEDPSLPMMRNPVAEYPTLPNGPWDGTTFINSGRMQEGETFSVTFSRAGAYEFVCIPHAVRDGMVGEVTVVPAGTPGVTTQAEVDDYVQRQFALFERQRDDILANRNEPGRVQNADGSTTWFVRNGTDQRNETDFMRGRLTLRQYFPNRLTISPGDSVVWYTDTRVPVHTVTFPIQNAPPPARWVPQLADGSLVPPEQLTLQGSYRGDPQSMDWPRIVENPSILVPSRPSPVYDPTQFFSSGEMGDNANGRAWSIRFDTPGTFSYFCVPHSYVGQTGEVTVLPR